ncbi:MAG TPA: lysine--tRNA ligase [Woeseiaceae bacterium]
MSDSKNNELDENSLIAERRRKLTKLREEGSAFPNDFRRNALAAEIMLTYGEHSAESLADEPVRVRVAGRMMAKRVMGKASFIKLQDRSGQVQVYVQRDKLPDGLYQDFKTWDVGDILGAVGTLFITRTGELTIQADELRMLTKSLRPLPEKFHGLADQETRYRRRYVDLIMNEESRRVFELRSRMIAHIRAFLDSQDYLEVETPMMQSMAGGALARPFKTHHNALDMELFLRIAPELNLKRLVVGGFERVYEINRNFRNEGVSTQHNPEFTMLELYRAYADYEDLLVLIESLLAGMAESLLGKTVVDYQGEQINFGGSYARMTVAEAILAFNSDFDANRLRDEDYLRAYAQKLGVKLMDSYGAGKLQIEIFEKTVEAELRQPTFVTAYPAEVSPLARLNDADPFVTDRFEFFIAGREIANGFSELNDPEDQAERFQQQVARRSEGDEEAMGYDADYIRALEYGLPPTAGLGVGIDRLVMLFSNSASIRDVLLFPYMRPEQSQD